MIKLFAIPMICSVMSGPVMKDVSYHHEYGPQQAVVYDDDDYEITLSADELNNYTWNNFNTYLYNTWSSDYVDDFITSMVYGDSALNVSGPFAVKPNTECVNFSSSITGGGFISFNYDVDNDETLITNKFYYFDENNVNDVFEYTLTLVTDESYYSDLKPVIQADIQANQTSSMPSIQDLFAQVTSAINAFIGSLGDAFTSVTALFWDSTAATPGPTFLGLLVLIGVGVGLVYAAYRVIKGLLHRI